MIIDRDIEFYENEVQFVEDRLRRCVPQCEPHWQARLEAAKKVLKSLQEYQVTLLKTP